MIIYYVKLYLAELLLDIMEVPRPVYEQVKAGKYSQSIICGTGYDIRSVEPIEVENTGVFVCVCQVSECIVPLL